MRSLASLALVVSLASAAFAHYTFPTLVVNGQASQAWQYIRRTNNYNSQSPVTDVLSGDFRCYTSQTGATASVATVSAGSTIGINGNGPAYHPGVLNVYLARAPNFNVATWDGAGQVWFKVYQITAITNGGGSISFPAQNIPGVSFPLPSSLPTGQYLVRIEHIALHSASQFQGAQFYISCGQINVVNGGNGNPGPLVSIPGVYSGYEPGILLNIYYPVPANYTQPGPAVWRG